jgi:hypothetical protein
MDFTKGRSGQKLRFSTDRIKKSLYQMHNDKGWLFETWVNENPICYERYWTECFFANRTMKTCAKAEICYNQYLNNTYKNSNISE